MNKEGLASFVESFNDSSSVLVSGLTVMLTTCVGSDEISAAKSACMFHREHAKKESGASLAVELSGSDPS